MGLEVSTYISGLTPSWPTASDFKSQGDDHLRLIKSVLQNTFPGAAGPLYFPKGEASSIGMVLDVTDQNNLVMITTTGGDVNITLPSGLTSTNIGWSCEIMKVSSDTNAAVVSPSSGTIGSQVGLTSTIRVGALAQPARFLWTGSTWVCVKPGSPIGSTQNFDGPVPYGFLNLDGSTYSSTTFAELFAALGTTTLADKRGRVEAGADPTGIRLSSTYFGVTANLGAVGGAESLALSLSQLPTGITSVNTGSIALSVTSGQANVPYNTGVGQGNGQPGNAFPYWPGLTDRGNITSTGSLAASAIASQSNNTGGNAHRTVQPTIVTNKYIRAC